MGLTKDDAFALIAGVVGALIAYALFKPTVAAGFVVVTLVGFAVGFFAVRFVIADLPR